jgi:glutamate--cysteine ligase
MPCIEEFTVSDLVSKKLLLLASQPALLARSRRGIEKEGLRVDTKGLMAQTPHPDALGRALTHPRITTDYSESLLELITGVHHQVDDLMNELNQIHRVAAAGLGSETIWNHSMPCLLPEDDAIPIAWYGTSNSGMLKHVYRRGLAVRYGRTMQCIAGVHYNFSFDDALWVALADQSKAPVDLKTQQSAGYVALIRNFMRYNWLLMYLFGASPAVSKSFTHGQDVGMPELDGNTLFLPYATSLRMSDLGYQNKAQSALKLCYNHLDTFLHRLYDAVTTPWPPYEAMGTHQHGEWIQLNCNLLQIENEFYSTIRPKRTTARGERPITALAKQGVQYVEVRCLDIDPFEPCGIGHDTARFVDIFLLYCALNESPLFDEEGHCAESAENFKRSVREGRKPGLTLSRAGQAIVLTDWAHDLLTQMQPCAKALAEATGDTRYLDALAIQRVKVDQPQLTPSARVLEALQTGKAGFQGFAFNQSKDHMSALKSAGLLTAEQNQATLQRQTSIDTQNALEAQQCMSFEEYVTQFNAALSLKN